MGGCLQVQEERDALYLRFTKAISEVQQKTGFKNLLLERKLQGLSSILEKKEVQLNEVLAASNLDPSALSVVTRKLEVRSPPSSRLLPLWRCRAGLSGGGFPVHLQGPGQKADSIHSPAVPLQGRPPCNCRPALARHGRVRKGLLGHFPPHSHTGDLPLQDVLDSKNNAIKDLQYELARVCKVKCRGGGGLRTYWGRGAPDTPPPKHCLLYAQAVHASGFHRVGCRQREVPRKPLSEGSSCSSGFLSLLRSWPTLHLLHRVPFF